MKAMTNPFKRKPQQKPIKVGFEACGRKLFGKLVGIINSTDTHPGDALVLVEWEPKDVFCPKAKTFRVALNDLTD